MGRPPGLAPLGRAGCAGLARSKRSSSGARSNRRMMEFISSVLGASMNAKPLDSCVSGVRITLIASATRFSAVSHPLISSAVTQVGKLPKKTVKLIRGCLYLRERGFASRRASRKHYHATTLLQARKWTSPPNRLTLLPMSTASTAAHRHAPVTSRADFRQRP